MRDVSTIVNDLKSDESYREVMPATTREEKVEKAMALKLRGIPAKNIAIALKVSQPTIYNWINEYIEKYKEDIEKRSGANLLSETMLYWDNLERLCLYEISQLGEGTSVYDTGLKKMVKIDQGGSKILKLKFILAAAQCRKEKSNLMLQTGILPKEPEKIYHRMEEEKRVDEKIPIDVSERSKKEIANNIVKLLERTRAV